MTTQLPPAIALIRNIGLRVEWRLWPPVIVSGMQKSGTTAIASLLGAAVGRQVANDPLHIIDWDGTHVLDALFSGEIGWDELIRRYPQAFRGAVIKDPDFIYFMDQLEARFPSARWVFVARNPLDTIRSVLGRVKLPGRPDETGSYPAPGEEVSHFWRQILNGRAPRLEGANYVERLAKRWSRAAELYGERIESFELIRYEDFLVDKEQAIRDLARRLGLSPNKQIAALLDHPFQAPSSRDESAAEFFGKENLDMIRTICRRGAERLGYAMRDERIPA